MKQLLFLFLFLLPCLAWAQYPSNGNQKITLGEQTTADGLIYRGVAATDTVRKSSIDTMAYMVLDTTTNIMWHYKKATSNAWLRLNLLPSDTASMLSPYIERGDTASMLTNYWRSGRFSGTLPVANGGTNRTTMPAGYILHGDGTSVDTSVNLFWDRTYSRLGIGTTSPTEKLSINGNLNLTSNTNYVLFGTNSAVNPYFQGTSTNQFALGNGNLPRLLVESNGDIRIYSLEGATNGRAVLADVNGVLSAPVSSINSKQNVQTLNYGLNELLQINPVSFDYINKDKWGEERNLGFIVEDMFPVIPEVTGTMNNGDMYLDMTKLIPVLTKAIQEQNALIKALQQRLLILENK